MPSRKVYPWFFFYRIARLALIVFLPTLFLILLIYRSSYKEGLVPQVTMQAEEDLRTTDKTLKLARMSWNTWCETNPTLPTIRYTLANRDGKILCDSVPSKKNLRLQIADEINQAFTEGFGTSVRFSDHFGTQAVFAGLKVAPDLVVRKVVPISSLKDNLNRFDRILLFRIIPFAFVSYVVFLFLFYDATRPLGTILDKVEKFKADVPFNKTLDLLYRQNEWAQIEEALNEADHRLKDQVNQVKSENVKIAAILESIYDNIIAIDNFESVLFYNSNFQKNFIQVRKEKELVPKIWHSLDDERVLKAFRSVLKNGKTQTLKGINFLSSLNPDRYYDLTIAPLKGADGRITGALGVFYDVSEFKLTEQMRVNFVANVSHEIRTPLTSIKGYTQILQAQKQNVAPELHLFLDKIIVNTERMISLFNDLLSLSVIESKNELKLEELDLSGIIELVSENIATNYPDKNIKIDHEINLKLIKGDQRLIEQVLSNLIDNACKYAGQDVHIKVSTTTKNGKGLIVVTDDGPGIPKDHLQRIFERFYRVDTSRETSRGTGLGLSIVKHIITKHGGQIWAESEERKGSTFFIELPL